MDTKELQVIYEDNHILVVIKEEGILSQKDITNDVDMTDIVKDYLKNKYNKLGNVYLGLIHRLDRRVGGIMVFAKTSKAAARLSEQIRDHLFNKTYLAVVKGELTNDGELTDYIYKKNEEAIIVDKNHPLGKLAILKYKIVNTFKLDDFYTCVMVDLVTGRYNQIRKQFANANHPLMDDYKYGYNGINHNDRIGLWCYKISFTHPVTKENMEFEKLPEGDFWKYIEVN